MGRLAVTISLFPFVEPPSSALPAHVEGNLGPALVVADLQGEWNSVIAVDGAQV